MIVESFSFCLILVLFVDIIYYIPLGLRKDGNPLLQRKRRRLLSWVASSWVADVDTSFTFDPILSRAFLASVLISAKRLAFFYLGVFC